MKTQREENRQERYDREMRKRQEREKIKKQAEVVCCAEEKAIRLEGTTATTHVSRTQGFRR